MRYVALTCILGSWGCAAYTADITTIAPQPTAQSNSPSEVYVVGRIPGLNALDQGYTLAGAAIEVCGEPGEAFRLAVVGAMSQIKPNEGQFHAGPIRTLAAVTFRNVRKHEYTASTKDLQDTVLQTVRGMGGQLFGVSRTSKKTFENGQSAIDKLEGFVYHVECPPLDNK